MKKELLDLFKSGKYSDAKKEIRKLLKTDLDNSELNYYLFLAENSDYANIDLNNIASEATFNKALENANRRFKNEYEAEYKFFRDCDENFRKLFCYAIRGDRDSIFGLIDNVKSATLPNNIDEYFSNLDYLLNSRKDRESFELVMMIVNFLYLLTNDKRLVRIYEDGKKTAVMFNPSYMTFNLAENYENLKSNFEYSMEEMDEYIKEQSQTLVYEKAIELFNNEDYLSAYNFFAELGDYKESKKLYKLSLVLHNEKKEKDEIIEARNEKKEKILNNIKDVSIKILRFIEPIFLFGLIVATIVFAVLFGIILFSNKEQISEISSFAGWLTGWIFYLVGTVLVILIHGGFTGYKYIDYFEYDEIHEFDPFSWVSGGIVAVLLAFCITFAYVSASHLDPNYNAKADGNKNSYNEVIELSDLYTYECDYAIIVTSE